MTSLNETFPRSPSCRLSASRASAARSMSTSVVRKKCGMGPRDVASRLAIVLRIWVRGTSWYGAPSTAGAGDQLHHRFVGLDLGERLPRLHRVAFPLMPFHQAPFLHGRGERFHEDLGGHDQSR